MRPGGMLSIVACSLRRHALSTVVTALSVALASGLTMAVFGIQEQTRRAFTAGSTGFDAVLGARGSPLQLVLNSVFHLETSPGNIPWSLYESVRRDPMVRLAVPYAVGDNYRGFRVVGTTLDLFTAVERLPALPFRAEPGGRLFEPGHQEAVIGSLVARKTGLRVGDAFHPSHGVSSNGEEEHDESYRVVGVMLPTNTPSDRVVWISTVTGKFWVGEQVGEGTLTGIYRMEADEVAHSADAR